MFSMFLLFLCVIMANAKTFLIETGKSAENQEDMVHDYALKNEDKKKSITLQVLLMNVWGLRFGEEKETRIPAIANFLKKSKHDIVVIQEAWHYSDYEKLRATFPYSTSFGTPGSSFCPSRNSQSFLNKITQIIDCNGLTILSKYKIIEVDHVFFKDRMRKITEGAVKRGAFAATMQVLKGGAGVLDTVTVSVINTHLTSWHDKLEKKHSSLREKQADDVIKLIADHKTKSDVVIVAGDLNSTPGSPVYNKFISAGLTDTLVELEGEKSSDHKYATWGHSENTWSSQDRPARIDFIMYSFNPSKVGARTAAYNTVTAKTEKDGKEMSLSDHQWVEASINFNIK